jgi:predicted RNA-binding protein with PIN domain
MRSHRELNRPKKPCDWNKSMRSLWLVDGYNVLRVSLAPDDDPRWWSAERRSLLITLAGRLSNANSHESSQREICLVFDGRHLPAAEEGEPIADDGLRVVFAPSADDWIVETLKRRRDEFDEIRVVTADRALANRARSRGAEVVPTNHFIDLCEQSKERQRTDG